MQDSHSDPQQPKPADTVFFGKKMGLLGWIVNVTGLTLMLSAAVAFLWLMSSLPRVEGRVPAKGMEYAATVARDAAGIPFVTARSGHDAYFALGWVHAQDRLWQMEVQRRVGAGRLAEVVGVDGLKNDRFMRTLGLYRLAEQSFATLDEPTQNALKAYAEGVNTWIDDNWHRLPPEFLVLGLRPEPWRPADSLVWGRLMALQLTADWREEALRGKLASKLPARRLAELWPDGQEAPNSIAAALAEAVLAAVPDTAAPRTASNVVAVSGKRSASGAPLLANDPHMPFQVPNLWYLAAVEAPGLRLTGAMVPGVPFHLIGHNGRVAWGTTTTHADTVDLFVETLAADGGYMVGKSSRPFVERQETILVKGYDPEVLTVRESRHGPIVSDLVAGQKDGQVVALKATALEPDDRTAQALYRLGRTVDWRSFVAALSDFHAPVQNFAFADTAGTIAFITAGRVPVRAKGDGFTPAPGASGAGEWTGWVPFTKLPQVVNPKNGVVINANNQVTGPKYPYRIATRWHEGYRARRIEELLEGRDGLTTADLAALQRDARSTAAEDLKELLDMQGAPLSPAAAEAAQLIAQWDGTMDRDQAAPTIFNLWLAKIWRNLVKDELGDDFDAMRFVRVRALGNMLAENRHWCDDIGTEAAESCEDMLARSLAETVAELAVRFPGIPMQQWRWGDSHQARFIHPVLGRLPFLSRFTNTTLATDGDNFTVNRGSFVGGDFTHVHGPGLRVVFDLADLEKSRFVLAGGQSGNPLSRHYADQFARWLVNDGLTLTKPGEGAAAISLEPSY